MTKVSKPNIKVPKAQSKKRPTPEGYVFDTTPKAPFTETLADGSKRSFKGNQSWHDLQDKSQGGGFQMGDVGTPFPMTKPTRPGFQMGSPREEQEHLDELEDYQRPQYEPDWFGEIRKYPGSGGSGGRKPKRVGDNPFEY